MNKLRLLLLALLSLAFVACENGENNDLPNTPEKEKCYTGTIAVDQNDGTFYTQEDVLVDYEIKDGKLNFVMYKVKFADGMPLKLDMVVEGANCEETATGYTISGEGLVPYAMGGPFEKFTITNLEGEVSASTMSLSFTCGEYPVTYNGTK